MADEQVGVSPEGVRGFRLCDLCPLRWMLPRPTVAADGIGAGKGSVRIAIIPNTTVSRYNSYLSGYVNTVLDCCNYDLAFGTLWFTKAFSAVHHYLGLCRPRLTQKTKQGVKPNSN